MTYPIYTETVPQPVGRVYKSPSSVAQSSMSSFQIIPVQVSQPLTPTDVVEAVMNLSTPNHEAVCVPFHKVSMKTHSLFLAAYATQEEKDFTRVCIFEALVRAYSLYGGS